MYKRKYSFLLWIVIGAYVGISILFGSSSILGAIGATPEHGGPFSVALGWLTGSIGKGVATLLVLLPTFLFLGQMVVNNSSSSNRSTHVSFIPYSKELSRVDEVLEVLGLFLPSRIMKEDAGDARELIEALCKKGAPAWRIYTKLASATFWILLAAVREVLSVQKRKPN